MKCPRRAWYRKEFSLGGISRKGFKRRQTRTQTLTRETFHPVLGVKLFMYAQFLMILIKGSKGKRT